MKWALAALIVLSACASSAAQPRPLGTVGAVRLLSHADAAKSLPVDLEATVTYFRGYEHTFHSGRH